MKRILHLSILALFLTLAVMACKHKALVTPAATTTGQNSTGNSGNNGNNGSGGNGGSNTTVDTGICFQRDVLPIFVSNCAKGGCHDAVTRADGYQFTDHSTITSKKFVAGNAGETELYEKIMEERADKIMPPPPNPALTDRQKYIIRRWIDEGANNKTDCGMACDSNSYTYGSTIKPMLEQYCKGCHNSASPSGGYSFDTYAGVKLAVDNNRLLGAIGHQSGFSPMPKGGNKLSGCQIKQVEKWMAGGAPNN